MFLYIECKDKVFFSYGALSVAFNVHLLRMTLYFGCKDKVFLPYGSSSVPLNPYLMRLTLYIDCKDRFFLLYGSSNVPSNFQAVRMILSIEYMYEVFLSTICIVWQSTELKCLNINLFDFLHWVHCKKISPVLVLKCTFKHSSCKNDFVHWVQG